MTNQPHNASGLTSALVLSTGRDEPVRAVPLALEGYPTHITTKVGGELKNIPVSYWKKAVLETGHYTHPITGEEFDLDAPGMDSLVQKFDAMRSQGIEIPCPVDHSKNADDNRGFVVKAMREGSQLHVIQQVFGEDGALMASRNRCSAKITPDFKDEKGKHWGPSIEHVSFTPIPVIQGQGQFVPFAASRGEQADTPILYLSASSPTQEILMDLTKLRAVVNAAEKSTDDQIIELAAAKLTESAKALELSRADAPKLVTALADAATLKTRAETAEAALATAGAKVLELSRTATPADERVTALVGRSYERMIDQAFKDGKCTKAQFDLVKAEMKDGGKYDPLMLSRSEVEKSPIDLLLKVLELNKAFTGTVTGFQLPDPNASAPTAAAEGAAAAAAYQAAQLKARGMTAAA